jgi:uncharacterized protein with PIN domain
MTAVYVETSAVLCWLLGEPEATEVRRRVDGAKLVATSVLTFVESERALIRAEAVGKLTGGDAQRLRGMLHRARTGWVVMEVSEQVRDRAARAFPVEPVRTLDAIHLATALAFSAVFPELRMLSFDARVRDNCEALGIG